MKIWQNCCVLEEHLWLVFVRGNTKYNISQSVLNWCEHPESLRIAIDDVYHQHVLLARNTRYSGQNTFDSVAHTLQRLPFGVSGVRRSTLLVRPFRDCLGYVAASIDQQFDHATHDPFCRCLVQESQCLLWLGVVRYRIQEHCLCDGRMWNWLAAPPSLRTGTNELWVEHMTHD